jgi:tetratricopeptide (TPR) repeat protein
LATAAAVAQAQGFSSHDVQTMTRMREMSPRINKARELVNKKDFAKAKKELESIIAKMPELAEAHFLMAKVLYSEKDYPGALASMLEAEKTHEALAGLMADMRDDRRADLAKRRSELERRISEMRGRIPAGQGEAARSQAAALNGEIARAEQMRTDIDREMNDTAPGSQTTARTDKPAEYPFFHGNILLRLQKYPEAVAQYQQALTLNPGYADAANNLASLYYSAKQYQKAHEVLAAVEAKGATVNPELKKAIADALPKS